MLTRERGKDLYVSGSAFKLVNKRAYHHGTMLIDAQLGNLRGVLGSKKVPPPLSRSCRSNRELTAEETPGAPRRTRW